MDNYISVACAVKARRNVDSIRQEELCVINRWAEAKKSEKVGSLVLSHDFCAAKSCFSGQAPCKTQGNGQEGKKGSCRYDELCMK